ncbi:FimV/HubP family polar landmark protein [Aliikangiella sp. IMCC44632]
MFRKLVLLIITTASFYSSAIFAVGLGEYKLNSGLNQPLRAEIVLLSAGDLGEHEVHASLASLAEFEKVGVERLFYLNEIKFETVKSDNGQVKILMTTREPIKEPFLNFLVELNWPNGRIIREYTFLLDPPVFEKSAASTIEKASVKKTSNNSNQVTQQAAQSQPEPTYSGSSYGPVSANDTLWSIASKVRPNSQVSIHQTLVALYRANPDAFGNGNINNLLRGKVLKIPDEQSIANVAQRAALQDVVMQNRQWKSGGARQIIDNSQQTSQREISSDARLRLASPSDSSSSQNSAGGTQAVQQIQNELARTQEQSATLQAENEELRSRLADALQKLESIQGDSAVNIADAELAALTQANQDTSSQNDSGIDAESTDSNAAADELAVESSDSVQTADNATDTANDNAAQAVQQPKLPEPKKVKPKKVYTPKQEKGFFESILDSGMALWGSIGVILLVVIAVFWKMRKRMEEDDFQDDLVASAGAAGVDTSEDFELPDVGDDMLVELDMDEDEDASKEGDDESFDPLGEADIYIAYGKYEQAETLLLEAIEDNPIRSDLKVKLMECYAENDDQEKFDSLAEEVSQAVDSAEWESQIKQLKEQAWGESANESGEEGFDLPSTEDIFGEDEFSIDDDSNVTAADTTESDEEFDIDMDFDTEKPEEDLSGAVTETFDAIEDELSIDEIEGADELDSEIAGGDFELDIEDDLGTDSEQDDDFSLDIGDDSDEISLDLDDDEFDIDGDESNFDEEDDESAGDEIGTKLDLARAYIDMGDSEGAKEILAEVVAEGDETQKQEAQALLDKAD